MRSVGVALFAASVMLSGCAANTLRPEDEKRIKAVAVVSLLPEQARVEKIGLTVFNNEYAELNVGSINPTVERVSIARIKAARPDWSIKSVAFDRERLLAKMNERGMVMAFDVEKIEKELAGICEANGVDALFVVSEFQSDYRGVGVRLRAAGVDGIQYAVVHSWITLLLVGPDGKVLVAPVGLPEPPKPLDHTALGLRYELKESLRPEVVTTFTNEILQVVEAATNREFDQLGFQENGNALRRK